MAARPTNLRTVLPQQNTHRVVLETTDACYNRGAPLFMTFLTWASLYFPRKVNTRYDLKNKTCAYHSYDLGIERKLFWNTNEINTMLGRSSVEGPRQWDFFAEKCWPYRSTRLPGSVLLRWGSPWVAASAGTYALDKNEKQKRLKGECRGTIWKVWRHAVIVARQCHVFEGAGMKHVAMPSVVS